MQQRGADLGRDTAGDHRHRQQQRQHAVFFHRLERDAGQADIEQALGQRRLGGQVQVAEQQMMLLQQRQITGDRLFHLDDQLADFVQRRSIGDDLDALLDVDLVGKAALQAGTGLEENFMATAHQIGGGGGNEGNTTFEGLGFGGDTDTHGGSPVEFVAGGDLRAPSRLGERLWPESLNRGAPFPILAGSKPRLGTAKRLYETAAGVEANYD